MRSAFGVEHGPIAKSDRTSRLSGDAAAAGGIAAGAHYAQKAAKPVSGRYAAKAVRGLLQGDTKLVRRAGTKAIAARKAAPYLRGAKLASGGAAAALGAAAIDSAISDKKRKTPDLPPVLGTPRKGRYDS